MQVSEIFKGNFVIFCVEKVADEIAETEISNCYMIGDNPRGDIRGANDMGWTSILVR